MSVARPQINSDAGPVVRVPPCPVCRSYAGLMVRWHEPGDITRGYDLVPCPSCRSGADAWAKMVETARLGARLDNGMESQTFESFHHNGSESSYKAARSFATTPRGVLVLAGRPGTGKTHLMAAIANTLLAYKDGEEHGLYLTRPKPLYVVASRYIEFAQRAAFERDADQKVADRQYQDMVLDCGVLLLDDLGAERDTATAQERVFNLVDYRYANGRPTVIATNLRPEQFPPRLASRLQDKARCRIVVMSGPDYRQSQQRREEREPWDVDETAGREV